MLILISVAEVNAMMSQVVGIIVGTVIFLALVFFAILHKAGQNQEQKIKQYHGNKNLSNLQELNKLKLGSVWQTDKGLGLVIRNYDNHKIFLFFDEKKQLFFVFPARPIKQTNLNIDQFFTTCFYK